MYSATELLGEALVVLRMFLERTPFENLKENMLKIYGAILRVSNYRLSPKQKMSLQEFVQILYEGGRFNLDCYQYQSLSMMLKFLSSSAKDK